MATKRVKFIKPWNMAGIGAVMDLDVPIADLLIKGGRAEEIVPEPPPLKPFLTERKINEIYKSIKSSSKKRKHGKR